MSQLFATQKEKEMHLLKKRHMHSILLYNMQQIQHKRKKNQRETSQNSSQNYKINQDAIKKLMQENDNRTKKKIEERSNLRYSYDRQIKEKEEKMRIEKIKEIQYFNRQKEQLEYEEEKRLIQLSRMFNRITYRANPIKQHKRSKTQPIEAQQSYNYQYKSNNQTQKLTVQLKPVTYAADIENVTQRKSGSNKKLREDIKRQHNQNGFRDSLDKFQKQLLLQNSKRY